MNLCLEDFVSCTREMCTIWPSWHLSNIIFSDEYEFRLLRIMGKYETKHKIKKTGIICINPSVADPDPGSGIRDLGSRIRCLFDPWIRDPE
jgi:hypothetical protein